MINYSIAIMSTKPGTKKENIKETKAYGTAQIKETLSLDQFCQHMADHNSPFSKGTIKGILTDAVTCLREQLLEGNKVNFGDLGSFYNELSTTGAKTVDLFTANNIKKVRVRWEVGKQFRNLIQDAKFQLVPTRKKTAAVIEEIKNTDTKPGLDE